MRNIRIPHSQTTRTRLINYNIFDLVRRSSTWHGTMKSESENLVDKLKSNNIFKMLSAKMMLKLKNLGAKFYKVESYRFDSKLE